MTVADDEELYPADALEIGRDLPLTFQYRTELSVIAGLAYQALAALAKRTLAMRCLLRQSWPMSAKSGFLSRGGRHPIRNANGISATPFGTVQSSAPWPMVRRRIA